MREVTDHRHRRRRRCARESIHTAKIQERYAYLMGMWVSSNPRGIARVSASGQNKCRDVRHANRGEATLVSGYISLPCGESRSFGASVTGIIAALDRGDMVILDQSAHLNCRTKRWDANQRSVSWMLARSTAQRLVKEGKKEYGGCTVVSSDI